MTKWKRTVVYGLLTVMAVGCVEAKAYPVMAQEKEGTAGRYMEKEISLPETGCVSAEEICFLEDGTFRAVYRAVSYTHLDVYKRQFLQSLRFRPSPLRKTARQRMRSV